MAKSQETFNKKEKEKKRLKKRDDKKKKKEERRENSTSSGSDLDSMIAYVDENGNLSETPPDPTKKKKIKLESIEIGVAKKDDEEIPTERKGKVEFFNDSKGFGFIKEQITNEKFFVHVHGLIDEIVENDIVTFELEQGMKGLNAVRVKKV